MIKRDARKHYLKDRRELKDEVRDQYSKQIAEQLLKHYPIKDKCVSVFMSIDTFAEVDTSHYFQAGAKTIALPVVKNDGRLEHIVYESQDQIEVTKWGIPEPIYGEQLDEKEFDVVIVPMVIADERGYRVGYGKGFYDGFLAKCRPDCQFIGVCFYEPIEEIEDVHEHDVKLHACVTPSRVHLFT